MSVGDEQPRASWLKMGWLKNVTKSTVMLLVAGVVVLGGGAAGAAVMVQQVAAVREAEAELLAAAERELEAAHKEYKQLVIDGGDLVDDLRLVIATSASVLPEETLQQQEQAVESLEAAIEAGAPGVDDEELQEQIVALERAIAEAWLVVEAASSTLAEASEATVKAAVLADPKYSQKMTDALAALAAAIDAREDTAGILETIASLATAAQESHQAAEAAALAAQQEAERKAKEAASKPPAGGSTDKPADKPAEKPVDKTGWYTEEEARAKVVATYGAVPWYDSCVKIGWGDWHRDATPTAPPAYTGKLGFKAGVHYGGTTAWVYYYDCP